MHFKYSTAFGERLKTKTSPHSSGTPIVHAVYKIKDTGYEHVSCTAPFLPPPSLFDPPRGYESLVFCLPAQTLVQGHILNTIKNNIQSINDTQQTAPNTPNHIFPLSSSSDLSALHGLAVASKDNHGCTTHLVSNAQMVSQVWFS